MTRQPDINDWAVRAAKYRIRMDQAEARADLLTSILEHWHTHHGFCQECHDFAAKAMGLNPGLVGLAPSQPDSRA